MSVCEDKLKFLYIHTKLKKKKSYKSIDCKVHFKITHHTLFVCGCTMPLVL